MEFVLLLLVGGALLYFLPSLIGRRKRDFGAIFALNLLLGWTFVGWVVSLVWALAAENPSPWNALPTAQVVPQTWLCANCRAQLRRTDQFCPSCGGRVNWYPS
jgi:hypothetical protein